MTVDILITRIAMIIENNNDMALTRLMQLISPSLPIGGYSYSQGIEWAVDARWISNADELCEWLTGLINTNMLYLEIPILKRMLEAWSLADFAELDYLNELLMASRETAELRLEESNRARAFKRLLISLEPDASQIEDRLWQTQTACYSFACQQWGLQYGQAAYGFIWSWLENLVLAAVKIVPLGQTDGQKALFQLASAIPLTVKNAALIGDDEIGASSMALAIASSQHETQYTRLFRS